MFSIERSGYYAWLNRKPSARAIENAVLDNVDLKNSEFISCSFLVGVLDYFIFVLFSI